MLIINFYTLGYSIEKEKNNRKLRVKIIAMRTMNLTLNYRRVLSKEKVPRYMLPNVWRISDSLPMNANGKIDRPKLKESYFNEKNK